MRYAFIVATIIAFIAVVTVVSSISRDNRLKAHLQMSYGKKPSFKRSEDFLDSVSGYWQYFNAVVSSRVAVDDTTWRDLDMNRVFLRIDNTCSSIGDEYLYAALHDQEYDRDKLDKIEELVKFFECHADVRQRARFYLAKLGKKDYNGVADFIFDPESKELPYHWIYWVLFGAAVLSVLTLFINLIVGITSMVIVLIVNIFVYYKKKSGLEAELISLRYISGMMACAKRLSKLKSGTFKPYADNLAKLYEPLKPVFRLSGAIMGGSSEIDFIKEYLKLFFMLDFVMYNRFISAIKKHTSNFHNVYRTIGLVETAISIASYRKSVPHYTVPVFTRDEAIVLDAVVHPLLDKPVANTATLTHSALITGSNASGKSTFIKAVAINTILAQTIHTCLAVSFQMKPSFVVTSMAVSDSIEGGESYYIAEIKSLKRVLDGLDENYRCLCFVDEILKGTNTIERIAASAAILKFLSGQNCFALVATHDIELTEMTRGYFDNYHFRETVGEKGITFDYKIHDGWATSKNAIKLLEYMEYDPDIIVSANRLAGSFEKNRVWPVL